MPHGRMNDGLPRVTTGRSTGTPPSTRASATLPAGRWGSKPPISMQMNDSLPNVRVRDPGPGTTLRPTVPDPNWPAPQPTNTPQPGAGGKIGIYNPFMGKASIL